jgi:hypothetical protein
MYYINTDQDGKITGLTIWVAKYPNKITPQEDSPICYIWDKGLADKIRKRLPSSDKYVQTLYEITYTSDISYFQEAECSSCNRNGDCEIYAQALQTKKCPDEWIWNQYANPECLAFE